MQKQLDIFDTDYESCNYTKTSQEALATIKPKIKTKREQVYDLIKLNALNNYEIADELGINIGTSKSNFFKGKAKVKKTLSKLQVTE